MSTISRVIMSVHRTKLTFLLPLLFWFPTALAQQVVELNRSDSPSGFVIRTPVQNGRFSRQHSGPMLFCDRVADRSSIHQFSAYGHVLLVQGDSITIKSDSLVYDSNRQQAVLYGHVMFQDRRTILTTSKLDYNLSTGVAHYDNRARIVDNRTVVTSQQGTYAVQLKEFTFRTNVRLMNGPNSTVADSLRYTTTSQLAVRLMPAPPVNQTGTRVARQSDPPISTNQEKTSPQNSPLVVDAPLPKPVVTTAVVASTEKAPVLDSVMVQPALYRAPVQNAPVTTGQIDRKGQESPTIRSVASKSTAKASLTRRATVVSVSSSADVSQESDLERELNKRKRFN